MNNISLLKKKIKYRSEHRGIKEMDLLMGSFVKKYLNELDFMELQQLDDLLNIDDDNLFKWYSSKESKTAIKIPNNKVSNLLKNFKI